MSRLDLGLPGGNHIPPGTFVWVVRGKLGRLRLEDQFAHPGDASRWQSEQIHEGLSSLGKFQRRQAAFQFSVSEQI
jgi:hypothetical protein